MEATPATGRAEKATKSAPTGALPNLIVIGAQKCGTSVLHYYLGLHPAIAMSQTKELNFFIGERNWQRGVDWYRSQFDAGAPVRGESSPNYTAVPRYRYVSKRMHSLIPDAKLVYLVRDPVERIAAHWIHNYAKQRHHGDLGRPQLKAGSTYVSRSRYHKQLGRFLRFYPLDQVLIVEQNDLRHNRAATLRTLFEFAGVDPGFTHPSFRQERHKTDRKTRPTRLGARLDQRRASARHPILSPRAWDVVRARWPLGRRIDMPEIRAALSDEVLTILREDAERLRELAGRDFSHWSIWDT